MKAQSAMIEKLLPACMSDDKVFTVKRAQCMQRTGMVRMGTVWLLVCAGILYGGIFSSEKKTISRMHPPMEIGYEKSEAFTRVNQIREALGMNTLESNALLAKAAQSHADYLVRNHVSTHTEIRGFPKFTGIFPADRVVHAGYYSRMVLENLSTRNDDAESSVSGLFSAIYHRFAFLDVGIDQMGVGVAQERSNTKNSAFVYEMGNSEIDHLCRMKAFSGSGKYVQGVCRNPKHRLPYKRFLKAKEGIQWLNPKIILYPYDGQEDVPPAFYAEVPDPLPDFEVSGFPVSVMFNEHFFSRITLRSFRLYDQSGREVVHKRILSKASDPNGRFNGLQFALFPLKRLAYDTQYRARIVYVDKGTEKMKEWFFHTHKPEERLLRITKEHAKVTLQRGRSYQLYFVPKDGHDILSDVLFPDDIDISFVDNNTLRVRVYDKKSRDFLIKSGTRSVDVHIVESTEK